MNKTKIALALLMLVAGALPFPFYWRITTQPPVSQAVQAAVSPDLQPPVTEDGVGSTRALTESEQAVAVLGGFVIKPVYMLLALGLVVLLWRARALDLTALRLGMLAFLIGEFICWVNFPILREEAPLLEYGHSYGMVLAVAALTFALIEGVDARVIGFSEPKARCALAGLCRRCSKALPVPCALVRLFKLALAGLMLLTLIPLSVNPHAVALNTQVFGVGVNYGHPVATQLYEIRFSPLAALALFAVSFLFLQFGTRRQLFLARLSFAGGMGFFAFAFLRLALFSFYLDNLVWFTFWEEATELILVAGVGAVLWIFREPLAATVGMAHFGGSRAGIGS